MNRLNDMPPTPAQALLLRWFEPFSACLVAFSGGVDSAVVAAAAYRALGDNAVALTGVSPSLAQRQRRQAAAVARSIGVRHCFLPTQEFARPQYTRNAGDRCYFCKTELYARIEHWVGEQSAAETSSLPDAWTESGGRAIVVNGANLDDLGDHRPGLQAAGENQIRSPLAECGFSKNDVRAIAKSWSLDVWDAPASPCLASRVAYGEEVTAARMAMIDQAEQALLDLGFREVRVRYHRGDHARIEIPLEDLQRLANSPMREQAVQAVQRAGFRYISLDLQGFRSGNLNQLLSLDYNRES